MARRIRCIAPTWRTSRRECSVLGVQYSQVANRAFYRLEELRFNLLSPLLQIPPECLICMNEEGAQLRNESVPPLALLAGSPSSSSAALPRNSSVSSTTLRRSGGVERRIFVFDRDHLDSDPEEVSRALAISEEHVLDEAPLARELARAVASSA